MSKVDTQHKDFAKFLPKWQRCRDVSDGQDAVHAKGELYLPRLKEQEPADYDAYRKRAGLFNATWRTLGGLLGMMFRKPPAKDIPAGIESYMDDVDMAGVSLETFARKIALEVMEVGRVGIMIDHPATENVTGVSVDVAQKIGLRPMMTAYLAETIINWKYRRVRNHWMLSMVVLKEMVGEADGEFAEKQVEQYRVLDLDEADQYRVRVFRRKDGSTGEFVEESQFYPLMNGNKLDFIPFAIVGVDGIDSVLDEPPLIDLVDLNLAHYRVTADYEHGCHFTGLPTPYVTGFSPSTEGEKFYIGSTSAWLFSDPAATVGFLEFTGQGLQALKENLDRKEQQMAILGARMLFAEKRQVEAAATAAIHRTGESSVLAAIATGVSASLEWALTVFRDWAGATGDVQYQLNRDYNPAMLDAAQLTALFKGVQLGEVSSRELFDLMQRADLIDSEKTFEEHQEEIDVQEPPRPVVTAPANDGRGELVA